MANDMLDSLSIEIDDNIDSILRNLGRLQTAIRSTGNTARGAASGVVGSMNTIGDSASKAADGIGKVSEAAKDMGMTTDKSAKQTGESVEELKRKIDSVNKRQYSSAGAGVFAYLKKDSDVLKMKLDAARERLADLLNADEPNNRAIANSTAEVRRLTDAYVKAQKAEDEFSQGAENAGGKAKNSAIGISVFWNAMKHIGSISFKGIKGALYDLPKYFGGKLISNVRQAVSGIDQFFNSVKRIAFYRAIRTALKMITQGFTEGTKNLYEWSAAFNGSFAASMDKIATSTLYLKNSLGAMASPLIEAVAPAIDFVVNKFVDMFNVVNQVIAQITGKTSYTAAKKVAAQWQDASKSASGSAKKAADDIKRTILGFDEINKLNAQNVKTGGTGSDSGNATNASMMFEKRPIQSWISDMVNSGDYTQLGAKIAEKINNALGSINWDSIKSRAIGITDSITSLINGFIANIDPLVLGHSLAEVINTATTTIDRFWSGVKWDEAGKKLRKVIVKFFNDIDVETAADAFTGKFKSIITLVSNAIPQTQAEWNLIGTKISGFINRAILNIPWSAIGTFTGNLLVGALTTMRILAQQGTLTNIANGIKTAIETACSKITAADVQKWVSSVLKDVLNAVSVLMSIEIDLGGFKLNPLAAITLGVVAKGLLGQLVKNVFGAASGSLVAGAKGFAFACSIALIVDAGVRIGKIFNDVMNGNKIKISDITDVLGSALAGIGTALLFVNPVAGGIMIGLGVILKLHILDTIFENANKAFAQSVADNPDFNVPLPSWAVSAGRGLTNGNGEVGRFTDVTVNAVPGFGVSKKNNAIVLNQVKGIASSVAIHPNCKPGMILWDDKIKPNVIDTSTVNTINGEAGTGMISHLKTFAANVENTSTINTVNGKAGTGTTLSWDTFTAKVKDTMTKNTVNGVAGTGTTLSWDTFHAKVGNTTTTNTINGEAGSGMLSMWGSFYANVSDSSTDVRANLVKTWWGNPVSALGLDNLKTTVTVTTKIAGALASVVGRAIGGIFSGGSWHDIPQYAGGTTNAHGSLFMAGEAGPEVVGHVGGRTEVLNKSQLASSIYSAVQSAMAPAAANFAYAAQTLSQNNASTDYGDMYSIILDAVSNALSNDSDKREQTQLLRSINAKDTTVEVTTSAINKAQTRMNRRAGVTIAPVGT